jgi:hypothetical protein
MAKSNSAFELGGGDFMDVMVPMNPVVTHGIILGGPMSNFLF